MAAESAHYADAATRGRLRAFKRDLARRYRSVDRLWKAGTLQLPAYEMVVKTGTGRRRAYDKIAAALKPAGAVLEVLDLEGPAPIAVWTVLTPRSAVLVDADDPANRQPCVCVNYIVAGRVNDDRVGKLGEGLWSMEVADHALGRLMERAPAVDPAAAILLAHHTALGLRACDVIDPDGHPSTQLLLPAGPGAFRCDARLGVDVSLRGAPSLHLFAATWIADDMLGASQFKLEAAGVPGERLGDTWLLPPPLRRGSIDASGRAQVVPFRRLPDGLAQAMAPPVPSVRALPEALMAQLVAIADANQSRMDDSMNPVLAIAAEADVLFGLWRDIREPGGVGAFLIKGDAELSRIVETVESEALRAGAIWCVQLEQAVALREHFAERTRRSMN